MEHVALIEGAIEPNEWFVIFHEHGDIGFARFFAWGRFKHVSAWGYYPGFKVWLIYNPHWDGLSLRLIAHADAPMAFVKYTENCAVVKMPRCGQIGLSPISRIGFWCVPAIKHLLGVRCASLRPDAFYRYIIRHGGVPLAAIAPTIVSRPHAARGTEAGAG